MERDVQFLSCFSHKNHQFQRKSYIYRGKNRSNGMPRNPPLIFDTKPGSAHICGAMA